MATGALGTALLGLQGALSAGARAGAPPDPNEPPTYRELREQRRNAQRANENVNTTALVTGMVPTAEEYQLAQTIANMSFDQIRRLPKAEREALINQARFIEQTSGNPIGTLVAEMLSDMSEDKSKAAYDKVKAFMKEWRSMGGSVEGVKVRPPDATVGMSELGYA